MINIHSIRTNTLEDYQLRNIWWLQRVGLKIRVKYGIVETYSRPKWVPYNTRYNEYLDKAWDNTGKPIPDLSTVKFIY